jgi:hypothetical protein
MSDSVILPSDQDIEAVLFKRQQVEQQKHPDIRLVDKIILKDGPRAYKVASHWVFVNRHSGEISHHSLRLETLRRKKNGWTSDDKHSLTLEDKDEQEVTKLFHFLSVVLNKNLSDSSGDYLVIPVNKSVSGTNINRESLKKFIDLLQSNGIDTISIIIDQLIQAEKTVNISDETFANFLELIQKSNVDIVSRVLNWLLASEQLDQVINKLETLNAGDLQKLNTALGLNSLKNVLEIWKENKENSSEEFWQQVFSQNSFLFAQIFAFPVVIIKGKAYVGGKGISNTGGNIIDFLCANKLTRNAALVEIKTPKTKILGSNYRGEIYNVSEELSGSVVQISNYKNVLTKSYHELANWSEENFEVFDPKCVVIIGNISDELKKPGQRNSLELFRAGLKDVQVISYDELFDKIQILVNILEGKDII